MQRIRHTTFHPKWSTYISFQGSRTIAEEVMDDKETFLDTVAQLHIGTQHLWQHAQDWCKPKPDHNSAWVEGCGIQSLIPSRGAILNCWERVKAKLVRAQPSASRRLHTVLSSSTNWPWLRKEKTNTNLAKKGQRSRKSPRREHEKNSWKGEGHSQVVEARPKVTYCSHEHEMSDRLTHRHGTLEATEQEVINDKGCALL